MGSFSPLLVEVTSSSMSSEVCPSLEFNSSSSEDYSTSLIVSSDSSTSSAVYTTSSTSLVVSKACPSSSTISTALSSSLTVSETLSTVAIDSFYSVSSLTTLITPYPPSIISESSASTMSKSPPSPLSISLASSSTSSSIDCEICSSTSEDAGYSTITGSGPFSGSSGSSESDSST